MPPGLYGLPLLLLLLAAAVQRTTIEKLVLLLGGTFCHTLGRQQRATHLMLPRWGPDSADGSTGGSQPLHDSTVKKIGCVAAHCGGGRGVFTTGAGASSPLSGFACLNQHSSCLYLPAG